MPTIQLSDRAIIKVAGTDAEHFLQNILTVDLDRLEAATLKPGALLTPQGKILFDFIISRAGTDGFLIDCRADVADDFIRRLMLYRLRAKAEISKLDQQLVSIRWESDSASSDKDSTGSHKTQNWLLDTRFPAAAHVERSYEGASDADEDVAAWSKLRIEHGIAESGADYELSDAFPHDVLLDETDGVGFRKGCYIGQEVVSRMQHRGTARRRVMIVTGEAPLPVSGTAVKANNRPIGTLGTVSGDKALAIVRIDKVKAAQDDGLAITADDAILSLSVPSWARYTLPQSGGEE